MTQEYQINADWKRLAEQIVKPNQRVLVLGASDTGKTTFCRYLIDTARTAALKVALVDADIGQSQIGPPTTVGMKLYEFEDTVNINPSENNSLDTNSSPSENKGEASRIGSDLGADEIYFVGAISPQRNLLPILTGTRLMVDSAIDAGADFIVIDTTGYIHDGAAAMLKQQKIDLIRPNHTVCIGRTKNLDWIVGSYHNTNILKIHNLLPHQLVRSKSSELRKEIDKLSSATIFKVQNCKKFHLNKSKVHGLPFFLVELQKKKSWKCFLN